MRCSQTPGWRGFSHHCLSLRQDQGRRQHMAHIKVIHDPVGETLTVYWDNPEREEICEEVGHGIILIKDAQGEVIGFERLYFKPKEAPQELGVVLQTATSREAPTFSLALLLEIRVQKFSDKSPHRLCYLQGFSSLVKGGVLTGVSY